MIRFKLFIVDLLVIIILYEYYLLLEFHLILTKVLNIS